uniref:Pectinesterase n=2 Tax=Brassica oleracea TaxID=3712 RepID=A0A0D3A3I0_BRAOL
MELTTADVIVSQDGSGHFKTLKEAVAAAPNNSITRYVIYVKRGTYNEFVEIGKTKTSLTIVGDSLQETILTGNMNHDRCRNIQLVNSRLSSDGAVFYRCHIDAYQDTLYAHKYQQFYMECQITGTVDFICGDATAVFQNFQIEARRPLVGQSNVITAQSLNDTSEVTGFSFQRCNITASLDFTPVKATVKTFLGRITLLPSFSISPPPLFHGF